MSNLPSIRPDYWLQNAASLAMSALLARIDLNLGARPYFWIDIRQSPPHVEVIGHEPWRGRIDVRLHTPRRLAIRAPGHIALDAVMVTLDGQSIEPTWSGRYAHLDGLTAGQVITLTYPLQERQANYAIAGQPYTGWWRGATMVEIQPPGEGYPIYQCRHLVADDLSVQDPALIDVSNQPFSELSLW